MSVEGLLLRAAQLSGAGAGARALAQRLASVTVPGNARSCLDAGTPVQLTLDAPGSAQLRVGVRVGARLADAPLERLVPEAPLARLRALLQPLEPGDHPSLGAWLFWTAQRQSIYVDLRDPDPRDALARLRSVLPESAALRLQQRALDPAVARPWALRVDTDPTGSCRLHLHWLIDRHAEPRPVLESLRPGSWSVVRDTLGLLLRTPGRSGRFVVVTPLEDDAGDALRVINTGWTLVPEDDRKHRTVGAAFRSMGGARDHAEAIWSLCRGAAGPRWRVGRASEVRVDERGARLRLFLSPQVRERLPSSSC